AANPPRSVSEQHDVARNAFDRKIFIHGTDDDRFGLRDHGIERIFWNRAAAGDGGETAAAAPTRHTVYAITMQIGGVTPARGGDPFAQHFHDFVEVCAGEIAIGIGASHAVE